MNKRGFTLIELVVTMAVSSIFFTLALNLYGSASNAFLNYKIILVSGENFQNV